MAGILYLLPSVIAERTEQTVIPPAMRAVLPQLRHFLAEDVRTARRFLSSLKLHPSIEALQFEVLDKDTKDDQLPGLLEPLMAGHPMGLLSEAGCPGVADPGARAVAYAHRHQIKVVPLVGPSAILLALMGSGLNGQQFAFHGYLPVEARALTQKLQTLEAESKAKSQTQIFIETPYRNQALFQQLVKSLHPTTHLCVAQDLTGEAETITTKTIGEWRSQPVNWSKLPAVFLFLKS
jgi:16S rRNA (cytidine1402-2'-O)-methyltransferase